MNGLLYFEIEKIYIFLTCFIESIRAFEYITRKHRLTNRKEAREVHTPVGHYMISNTLHYIRNKYHCWGVRALPIILRLAVTDTQKVNLMLWTYGSIDDAFLYPPYGPIHWGGKRVLSLVVTLTVAGTLSSQNRDDIILLMILVVTRILMHVGTYNQN